MAAGRTYNSPLRASQAEQTRNLILDNLAEMVAEEGFEGIVINDLAKRAGMAARTIYRYFPDRDALHDALAERIGALVEQASTGLAGPHSEWPGLVHQVFLDFDRHETESTVAARLNAVRTATSAESTRRRALFGEQISAAYPDLGAEDVQALLAVLQILGSSRTWLRLKEELGMSGAESGRAVRWLIQLAIDDIDERGGIPTYDTDEATGPPSPPTG